MSQTNSYDRVSYMTNGVTKSFSFGWGVNSKDDVKVGFVNADGALLDSARFIDSNNVEYTTSDYNFSVGLNQQGGTVTFVDKPADDQQLIIYRETPLVYENSFQTATAFPASAIDKAYRKLWLALQEIAADAQQNTLRLTADQRDVSLDAFDETKNNMLLFFDFDNKKISYAGVTLNDLQALAADAADCVKKTGDTMSGALTFTNTAGAGGIFGYTNGVVFFYTSGDTRIPLAALSTQGFAPYTDDTMILGGSNLKWHEGHISTVYTSVINNGANISIPNQHGTMVVATPPTIDGTYVLKATVSGGVRTYSWVAE